MLGAAIAGLLLAGTAPGAGAAGPTIGAVNGTPPEAPNTSDQPLFKCTLAIQSHVVALSRPRGKRTKTMTGTLTLVVECNEPTTANVTGFLTATARRTFRTSTFEVGPLIKDVPVGARTLLPVKLPTRAVSALRSRAHLSANFTLVAGYSAHSTTANTSAGTLRLARKH